MRILTVRQPWAWAIIHGGKTVENRSRNIAGGYRGPVAIHAGLGEDIEAYRISDREHGPLHWAFRSVRPQVGTPPWRQWRGNVIGVVDLVDVHQQRVHAPDCSCPSWAETGAWHLVLANPRPLREPIPFKGALGLRTLDDANTARVLAAIA